MPHLESFYEKPYTHLFEFNKELLLLLIRFMKLEVSISYTEAYETQPADMTDMRKAFKPGLVIDCISHVPYMCAFENTDTHYSLSSLDLLFNEGPHSREILRQMIV
jgi:hypothetical protein